MRTSTSGAINSPTTPRASTSPFSLQRGKQSSRILGGTSTPRNASSSAGAVLVRDSAVPSTATATAMMASMASMATVGITPTSTATSTKLPNEIYTAAYPMHARVSASPSGAYIIIFWRDHYKFHLVRISDWVCNVISTFSFFQGGTHRRRCKECCLV